MTVALPLALAGTATAPCASVSKAQASHAPAVARPALAGYGLDDTDPGATSYWDSGAHVTGQSSIYDRQGDYLGYVANWYARLPHQPVRNVQCQRLFHDHRLDLPIRLLHGQVHRPHHVGLGEPGVRAHRTVCAWGTIYIRRHASSQPRARQPDGLMPELRISSAQRRWTP
jgi:hypothetical protein